MGGGIRKKQTSKEVAEDVSKASTIYQKVSAIDHVLLRPEMYIGSIENHYISKAWMMHSDAKPRILPKLLPAGPKFDASYKELHGSFVMDEDVKIESEGTESNADTEVISKVADNEIKGANNGDKVPNFDVIEGKIGGVDQKLCVAGEQNVEVIFGPGSLYQRDVWENPGLLKIVDEILVNAADNRLSTPTDGTTSQTFIKVLFDKETGRITVSNDGNGIPIVKHKDHNLWIPEMIFGHLLTSSHYENDPESVAAGRHGYGAKLTNIMSSEFTVTCHWKDKVFIGKWSDNMQKCDINVSSREYSNESFTEVSFVPEYDRFMVEDLKKRAKYEAELSKKRENDRLLQATKKKMVEMYGEKESKIAIKLLQKKKSDDIKNTLADGVIPADFNIRDELFCIVQKRCLDLAASIGSTQKVYFNDVCLTPRVFSDYCRMHFPEEEIARQPFYTAEKEFELGILFQPKTAFKRSFCHVSLVNGLVTSQGGSHLNHAQSMVDKVLSEVADILKAKARVLFNVTLFKSNYVFFVNATVHQPKFDSQSKAKLVSKHSFPELDLSGLKDHILSLPFLNEFCTSANLVDASFLNIELRKIKDKFNSRGITKLVEPSTIGNPNYNHVLILTEGDSAKALAVNSLSLEQRKIYGVFPLRGKVLNVRTHPLKKLIENVEVMNVFAAIGLTIGEKYESLKKLRYKKILIMTDQDQDGMHIRGLLMNLFQVLWPQLLAQNPGFISIFSTPLVKARISSNVTEEFYSTRQYDEWRESVDPKVLKSAKIRYYKGLGTSTSDEGRQYFRSIDNNTTEVLWNKDPAVDNNVLHNMFSDTTTDVRKRKMIGYVPTKDSFCEERRGTVESFVEKDLMKYAIYDNSRSIVSGLDGLKTSTRKVLWALLKRDPPSMRVSQLAGYVSEVSNYHHGEASLHGAIIHMAQNYTTSNNINYLHPEGQFGSRLGGGTDSAAPRYIFTKLDSITRLIYPKIDDNSLTYMDSDGEPVEPMCYAPVIPTAFLNGDIGIGFGFSSHFTPHDPTELINRTRMMIKGTSAEEAYRNLTPGYVGYRGVIRKNVDGEFWCFPAVEIFNGVQGDGLRSRHPIDNGHVLPRIIGLRITELPPMMTPEQFRSRVFSYQKDAVVEFSDFSGADHIDIDLRLKTEIWLNDAKEPTIECLLRNLGLVSKIRAANWTHSDINGAIQSYSQMQEEGIIAIAKAHYEYRLSIYEMRLKALKADAVVEFDRLTSIITFSKMVQSDDSIFKKSEEELIEFLKEKKVKEYNDSYTFLTDRPIVSFLSMNVASIEKRLNTVKLEKERLKSVTPKDLWEEDLAVLDVACKKKADTKKKTTDSILAQRKIKMMSLMDLYKSPMGANAIKHMPSFSTTKKRFSINEAIKAEMMVMGWSEDKLWRSSVRRVEGRKKLTDRRHKLKEVERNARTVARTVKKKGIPDSDNDDDNENKHDNKSEPSSSISNSAMSSSAVAGDKPLTAPFSAMTAPLSLAIRPADTFALINAALAHSVFTRRQHMTAFVTQRVGTLGAPVLGRLVSRFVF
eukprot:Tbor_TRINITY_DN5155_c0_g1::TRINITY_DN5155_c0_g1_i1::g.26250::m.26250/K03164/TOP2; DNA topoisomerase II